jgi:hypothetical protein
MRLALASGRLDLMMLAISFGLNLVYLLLGGLYFGWTLEKVRQRGTLARLDME